MELELQLATWGAVPCLDPGANATHAAPSAKHGSAGQHAGQHASSSGLDPRQILSQPSVQATLALVQSVPFKHLGNAAVSAALFHVKHRSKLQRNWGKQWLDGGETSCVDGSTLEATAEREAAEALVQLGWKRLRSLNGDSLVSLLTASLSLKAPAEIPWTAWLSAFNASGGVQSVNVVYNRVALLDCLSKLAVRPAVEGQKLPLRMLAHNLAFLCTSRSLHMLSLSQLARVYAATTQLGLKLYQEQHQALAELVKERFKDHPPAPVSLTELLGAWVQLNTMWRQVAAGYVPHVNSNGSRSSVRCSPLGRQQVEASTPPPQPAEGFTDGYPGDEVMEAVVMHFHLNRLQMGSMALGQLLRALGKFRYAPPQDIVADLAEDNVVQPTDQQALGAASQAVPGQQLRGLEDLRQVDAALNGLAELALDPGEAFAEACFQLAMADGGADQRALRSVAWSLVKLKRCTSEQWEALLALAEIPPSPAARPADSNPSDQRGYAAAGWLKAYCLMLVHHGVDVAPLPEIVRQQNLASPFVAKRWLPELTSRLPHVLAHQALRELCRGQHEVEEGYLIREPHTGTPWTLDLAVPELRFGLHVSRGNDYARNRGIPVGSIANLQGMGRLAGWDIAVLPPPRILTGQPAPLPGELPRAVARLSAATKAFLLQQTQLPQLLKQAARPPSSLD
ncbi:hypothetical protein N2152v2_010159 [Parachlorella kessleri]